MSWSMFIDCHTRGRQPTSRLYSVGFFHFLWTYNKTVYIGNTGRLSPKRWILRENSLIFILSMKYINKGPICLQRAEQIVSHKTAKCLKSSIRGGRAVSLRTDKPSGEYKKEVALTCIYRILTFIHLYLLTYFYLYFIWGTEQDSGSFQAWKWTHE